ncbi:MAG: ROK family protein [Phaeodactylibacter sp.]|nr:ROK family protein [Phaeodactylibacter sp.]MCB9276157.1 ROK family protein [Lewinellaceae bacterium]
MPVIGLDLGGTKLSGAVFTDDGDILHREKAPLEGRQGAEVGALIRSMVSVLINFADGSSVPVSAAGICVPGIAWQKTGRAWAPNIPGWDNYPVLDDIRAAAAGRDIAVRLDSDRACYILGETWKGAALGCRDAIFLSVGTGIGAGILVDGQVLRGAHDIAGAIGWLGLSQPYREVYAACGDFEYHASGAGMPRVALEMMQMDKAYAGRLSQGEPRALTAGAIFNACFEGDTLALQVVDQAITYWGMAVANLVSLFNPEKIIFGGGLFGPGGQFLGRIYEEALRWAQPISIRQVTLEASQLGGDAGLYGAGRLAMGRRTP